VTPKEELIQAIERSPDEIVRELLDVLQALQRQQQLETPDLQPDSRKTVLERMGGVPKHLLSDGNLSDRDRRRALISERLQHKVSARFMIA
jgi:hypothetical protein